MTLTSARIYNKESGRLQAKTSEMYNINQSDQKIIAAFPIVLVYLHSHPPLKPIRPQDHSRLPCVLRLLALSSPSTRFQPSFCLIFSPTQPQTRQVSCTQVTSGKWSQVDLAPSSRLHKPQISHLQHFFPLFFYRLFNAQLNNQINNLRIHGKSQRGRLWWLELIAAKVSSASTFLS